MKLQIFIYKIDLRDVYQQQRICDLEARKVKLRLQNEEN